MLVSECISAAYREADVTTIGTAPTDDENAEALALLNSFVVRLFGTEFGENISDWPVPPPQGYRAPPEGLIQSNDPGANWYLQPTANTRLLVAVTAATTIKFPMMPNDGAQVAIVDVGSTSVDLTLNGNGRLIDGQPTMIDTPQALNGKRFFYRADLASWQEVSTLGLNDALPLVADFDDLFVTYIAMRLMPRNAQETAEETSALFSDLLKKARRRYRQEMPVGIGDAKISESDQSFGQTGSRSWFQ